MEEVPGWFNADDAQHFYLVLAMQRLLGLRGDMIEIGSYWGRSTAAMAFFLGEGEALEVCDAFRRETADAYADRPSPSDLMATIRRVRPDLGDDRVVIHDCLSSELALAEKRRFRFAHIDGGHGAEEVFHDLSVVVPRMILGGLVVVDDYAHPDWPGVTEGTDRFLAASKDCHVVADLNRHQASGRKLYIGVGPAPS